jgi:hypothetical protein
MTCGVGGARDHSCDPGTGPAHRGPAAGYTLMLANTREGLMSTLNIDADTINQLLTVFASKPDGPQVTFENGQLILRMKGLTLAAVAELTTKGITVNFGVVR